MLQINYLTKFHKFQSKKLHLSAIYIQCDIQHDIQHVMQKEKEHRQKSQTHLLTKMLLINRKRSKKRKAT